MSKRKRQPNDRTIENQNNNTHEDEILEKKLRWEQLNELSYEFDPYNALFERYYKI